MSLLKARIRTAEVAKEPEEPLRCRKCGAPTSWQTLSELGAQCNLCYERWKREPMAGRDWPGLRGEKPTLDELVSRLEIRQAEGEKLGEAQLDWLAQAKRKLNPGGAE